MHREQRGIWEDSKTDRGRRARSRPRWTPPLLTVYIVAHSKRNYHGTNRLQIGGSGDDGLVSLSAMTYRLSAMTCRLRALSEWDPSRDSSRPVDGINWSQYSGERLKGRRRSGGKAGRWEKYRGSITGIWRRFGEIHLHSSHSVVVFVFAFAFAFVFVFVSGWWSSPTHINLHYARSTVDD